MFAEDIFIASISKEEIEHKLEQWKRALEDRGLKISKKKTEYLNFCEEEGEMRMQGEVMKRMEKFKYLGSVVSKDEEVNSEVTHRVQAEFSPTKKSQERKFEGEEMEMLRWTWGVTRLDKIRNERTRGTVKVEKFSKYRKED
ncbi:uncharacterized protein [Penaeus vannamei]|uniref:uncharacterized protein n=1 Tax=Penaeus vannamei TaxID=6689 RepID=UPI00387F89BE